MERTIQRSPQHSTTSLSSTGKKETILEHVVFMSVRSPCTTPMPPEGPEVAEALAKRARDATQPDPAPMPGPRLSEDELDTQLVTDELVPFVGVAHAWDSEPNNVVPASECAAVTELLDRRDTRHQSEAAIQRGWEIHPL